VKSGWDKRPCRSEPFLAKIRTLKKNIYIFIYISCYCMVLSIFAGYGNCNYNLLARTTFHLQFTLWSKTGEKEQQGLELAWHF